MFHADKPVHAAGWITAAGLVCWLLLAAWADFGSSQSSAARANAQSPTTHALMTTWSPVAATEPTTRPGSIAQIREEFAAIAAEPLHGEALPHERLTAELAHLVTAQQRLLAEVAELGDRWRQDRSTVEWDQRLEELSRTTQNIAPLEAIVKELRSEIGELRETLQSAAPPLVAEVEPETLTTKLYRLVQLRSVDLQPLLSELLTPGIGVWAASPQTDENGTAILVRDLPEVINQVDRLIAELDRPMVRVKLDLAVQEIDSQTGSPVGLPTPIEADAIAHDGHAFLIPESSLFPETSGTRIEESLPTLVRDDTTSATKPSAGRLHRALRITPLVVR